MDSEIAQKAAKWWADQLRQNSKLDAELQEPHQSNVSILSSLLQQAESERVTNLAIADFEEYLRVILMNRSEHYFLVCVDYNPDQTLVQAARMAKLYLGMTLLPWRTTMTIQGNSISVNGEEI